MPVKPQHTCGEHVSRTSLGQASEEKNEGIRRVNEGGLRVEGFWTPVCCLFPVPDL